MDGIPPSLPALLLALKVQKKAANAGMDLTSVEGAYEKVTEELGEVRADPTDREVGDLLFAVTGVAQQLGVDPEGALRSAATRFSDRFRLVEQIAEAGEVDLLAADGDAVDQLWEEAKRRSVAD
jgi:tetrapyrrole methylase family protein/MazG family protein